METLEYLVEQYQTKRKPKSEVITQFDVWLQDGIISEADVKDTLNTLLEKQKISTELHDDILKLVQSISGKTVISPPSANSAKTRIESDIDETSFSGNTVIDQSDAKTEVATPERTNILTQDTSDVNTVTKTRIATDNKTQLADSDKTIAGRSPTGQETRLASDINKTTLSTGMSGDKTVAVSEEVHFQKAKPIEVGSVIKERFILENIIGSGGMSIVFKALDLRKQEAKNKNPYVAIKVLGDVFKNHLQSLLVLERETQQIQKLAHPNIVTVYDFDRDGEAIYMTMECLQGKSLDQIIANHRHGITYEEATKYVEGMCRGLAYAHSKHIIHSDFKPENVFYTKEKVVKILDFGIARAKQLPGAKTDKDEFDAGTLGALTPPYASCEMFEKKEPDPRDDIYALGVVTYKLLTGVHPFEGMSAIKARDKKLKPKRIKTLTNRQWRTLEASLAFEREARIPTVVEFLNGFLPKQRSPWLYATAAALLLTVGVGGYSWFTVSTQPEIPQIKLTDVEKQTIADALETADVYISMGYLASPPGDSALDQYEKVLNIDPTNTQAIEGKKAIAVKYIKFAIEQMEKGNYDSSINYIRTGLIVEPDNEELKSLEDKVKTLRAGG